MVFEYYDPLAVFFCFDDIIQPSAESASTFFLVHRYKQNMCYLCEMLEFERMLKQNMI
jgi:hypothetical protein